jgi:hypothetical protein
MHREEPLTPIYHPNVSIYIYIYIYAYLHRGLSPQANYTDDTSKSKLMSRSWSISVHNSPSINSMLNEL